MRPPAAKEDDPVAAPARGRPLGLVLRKGAPEQEAQRPLAERVHVDQPLPREQRRDVGGQEPFHRRRVGCAVEDLGARLGRVLPEAVDLGPAALLERRAHVCRAFDVREEELVHEVRGDVLRNVGALETAGRQQRRKLLLGPGVGAGDVLQGDADHDESGFPFEQALQSEAPVAVVLERFDAAVELEGLVLQGVRQLVRVDEALGEAGHRRPNRRRAPRRPARRRSAAARGRRRRRPARRRSRPAGREGGGRRR